MKLSAKIANIVSQNFNSFVKYEKIKIHDLLSSAHKSAAISEINKFLNGGSIENLDNGLPGLREYIIARNDIHATIDVENNFIKDYLNIQKNKNEIETYIYLFLAVQQNPENNELLVGNISDKTNFHKGATLAHKSKIILNNLGFKSTISILSNTPFFIISSAVFLSFYLAATILSVVGTIIAHPFSNTDVTNIRQEKNENINHNDGSYVQVYDISGSYYVKKENHVKRGNYVNRRNLMLHSNPGANAPKEQSPSPDKATRSNKLTR